MKHPEFRYIVRRIQTALWAPFSEIQNNLIGKNCRLLTCLDAIIFLVQQNLIQSQTDGHV